MSTVSASCSVSASVVPPDPSSVEVESVSLVACYTVPQAEGERSVAFVAFGPDRTLVAIRSSGHLDSLEWCPSCAHHVEGASRDGGLPMPEGHWESARLPGPLRRLTRVESEREGFEAARFVAFSDRAPSGEAAAAALGSRWARFSPRAQGSAHRVRVVVPEALGSVSSIGLVFNRLGGPGK